MLLGVPREIKNHEYRVGMTPASVRELTGRDHAVLVEKGAGRGIGLTDSMYVRAGAEIVDTPEDIFARAEMIVKVKEPQPDECRMLRRDQILFTYLHLAPDPLQAQLLVESGCTAIAYETVSDMNGGLPLLAPMSEVAGRMSIQAACHCLEKAQHGAGVLLGGVPGVAPGKVVVIGGGVVGTHAARMAIGLGADVTVFDRSIARLRQLDELLGARARILYSTTDALEEHVLTADAVIGAVLIPGAAAPKLVTENHIRRMRRGSVVVDVAIDQGGCFETSRPTTHAKPTYRVHGVVHYCVANMPGGVARTSTFALNNATLPYIIQLADKGWQRACRVDPFLCDGLNVHNGKVVYKAVADALDYPFVDPADIL